MRDARFLSISLILISLVVLAWPRPALAQTADPIVGTWSFHIEQLERPPSDMLGSFTSDGIYFQNSEPGASSGHGLWRRDPDGIYQVKFEIYILDIEDPLARLRVEVRGHVRIDSSGNRLMGTFEADVITPAGEVLETSSGVVRAVRMTL